MGSLRPLVSRAASRSVHTIANQTRKVPTKCRRRFWRSRILDVGVILHAVDVTEIGNRAFAAWLYCCADVAAVAAGAGGGEFGWWGIKIPSTPVLAVS